MIIKRICLDEHRIGEHIDIPLERKKILLRTVGSVHTLDYLPVLVLHRRTLGKHGHTVSRIIIKIMRAQDIVLLITELHYASTELGQIVIYEIIEFLTGEFSPLLGQTDIAYGIDDIVIHPPIRGIAHQIGIVMEKSGLDGLPESLPRIVADNFYGFSPHQPDKAVFGITLIRTGKNENRQACKKGKRQGYFLTFSDHPLLENSQSANIGSITIYVSLIFWDMKSLIASFCLIFCTLL